MNKTDPLSTFRGRLDYVMAECGCEKPADFARFVGVSPANVTNWRIRGGIGKKNEQVVHERTGVNTDWLRTGKGAAFPNGAKKAPPGGSALLDEMDRDVEALRAIVTAVLGAMIDSTPSVAVPVAAAIRGAVEGAEKHNEYLRDTLRALDEVAKRSRRRGGA